MYTDSNEERIAGELAKKEAIENDMVFNNNFIQERKFKHVDNMIIKHVNPEKYKRIWEQADKLARREYETKGSVFVLIEGKNKIAFTKERREFHLRNLLKGAKK